MKNQVYTGTPTSPRFCPCPTSIVSGQPVLIGTMPAIALDNYQANEGGTTFYFSGTYNLSVLGSTAVSPISGTAIKVGDPVYADTDGTLDATTNVYYGFTLDANSSTGTLFGNIDPSNGASVSSGQTEYADVKLKGQE